MKKELKPVVYEEAIHLPTNIGFRIYPFLEDIVGIPSDYIKVSQETQQAPRGTYYYTFIEVHPKGDINAGHLQLNVHKYKDTRDPTQPDVNEVEYLVENSGRRDKDTRDGEAIARILATHGQSTESPRYKIQIDPQWGVTQVIAAQHSSGYGMLPHLDKEHRLVGLSFTPNLDGGQPPFRISTMVGDVEMLTIPVVRSRLAIASGIPRG